MYGLTIQLAVTTKEYTRVLSVDKRGVVGFLLNLKKKNSSKIHKRVKYCENNNF